MIWIHKDNKNYDISILIGNAIDHFDTALYSFLAPILAPLFFPHSAYIVQLILAYSIFATSIFTRPLGGYFFSLIATRHTPNLALSYSLKGIAITTIAMGCVPSYQTIGWIAPVVLITVRMLQGICAEGESIIAKLYLLENKQKQQAFTTASLYEASTIFGIITASTLSILIINNHHVYWRWCFIGGGICAFVSDYLRIRTAIPSRAKITNPIQRANIKLTWSVIYTSKYNIVRAATACGFSYMTYSIPFIVMNSFIPLITTIAPEKMMQLNTLLLILDLVMIVVIPFFIKNYIQNQYDCKKMLMVTSATLLITIIPLWIYLQCNSLLYITLVRLWIIFLGVIFSMGLNLWMQDLFTPTYKYILVNAGNAFGASLLGRLTPTICFFLFGVTNTYWSIGVYIAIISLITLCAIWTSSTHIKEN